jgi:hypothetical protein
MVRGETPRQPSHFPVHETGPWGSPFFSYLKESNSMRIRLFVFGVVIGAAMFGGGCPRPTPQMLHKAINCTAESVLKHWPEAYPRVQTCLSAIMISPAECLDALPQVLGVGLDVVACVARTSGMEAASQQEANPGDVVSARRYERARAWLESRHIEFE